MAKRFRGMWLLLPLAVVGLVVGCRSRSPAGAAIDPAGLVRRGWDAVDREDAASAREAIRSLRAAGAESLASLVQARLLVARGFFRPALDVLAAGGGPVEAGAEVVQDRLRHLVRGEAAYRMQIYPLAEGELRAVLADHPEDVDAHRLLGAMYYDAGVIPAAIRHLEATARLAPADPRPERLLGLIHNDYERYGEAVGYYEESLRRDPEQPDRDEVLAELAACQIKLRRHREALDTLAPLGVGGVADILRAECLLAIGDRDAARRIVGAVLRKAPDDLGALVLEGEVRLEDGDSAGAVDPLRRAVAAHPRDYLARLKLAQAYAGSGRDEEAEAERAEAERIRALRRSFADLHQAAWDSPGDAQVRRRLAGMAATLDRPDLEKVWLDAAAAVEMGRDGDTPSDASPTPEDRSRETPAPEG